MKKLAVFGLLLIMGLSAFGWYESNNRKKIEKKDVVLNYPTRNNEEKEPVREESRDGFLKKGDKYEDWIVETVKIGNDQYPLSSTNFRAYFTGSVTISGRFFNQYDDMLDNVYFFPSKEALSKLPNISGVIYDKPFVFRNKSFAEDSFFRKGSYGEAVVIIMDLELIRYPSEFTDSARLERVVSSSETGRLVYPKSLDSKYDDDLWKKYHSEASNLKDTYLKVGY